MTMNRSWRRGVMTMVLLVFGGGAAVIWAQAKADEGGGSLAALTAEVRQLRVSLEEAARTQAQTQALAVYLSAQQSRMVQLSARLDAVRNDLSGASARGREAARNMAEAQQEAAQATDPRGRAEAADMVLMFKQQADQAAAQEQAFRSRETDLAQALQAEEARWADLIARLEQSIKK